jgi:SAM-dependent methyltransferase
MNSPQTIRTFEDFRDAVFTFRLPRILLTALDVDLFTKMGDRRWTVPALARALRASPRGVEVLCRNLVDVGLLKKLGTTYAGTQVARTYLNARHPDYRGAYLELVRNQWAKWSGLTEAVRTGRPPDADDPDGPSYRRRFTWAMHDRSLDAAAQIAAQVPLQGATTLLDLGGGPGTYALAFLAKNPGMQATVCDRAPALKVAREIAARHPCGKRLSYVPLDFMTRKIPGRYDAVWYSNVLHIYSPDENQRLFRRIRAALNPGGRLFVHDAFVHGPRDAASHEANRFAVTMLLFTERGNTYRAADAACWLRAAGFARVRLVPIRKGTGDWEAGLLEAQRS